MTLRLIATGSYLPKKVVSNYDLEKNIEELKVIINNFDYDSLDNFLLKNFS